MPTSAFFNLTDDKKTKLIEAAKKEFANNLFEDASINQIIKDINMPRGSFYLYFENKEDIYNYIFTFYKNNLIKRFIDILKENNGNIFDSYIILYDFIIDNSDSNITLLINKFFLNMNTKRLESSMPRKDCKKENDKLVIANINKDTLNLKEDDIYVLISILMPMFFQNVAHTFSHPEQKEKIKEHYIKQLNIIRKGIEREKLC